MKITTLNPIHKKLGGKMVEYAGFEMPVQYSGIKEEHIAVREKIGLFDVSHMGEFVIKGKDATALLQYICSNDIEKMHTFQCQYNYMPNKNGGIIDDLIVYKWNNDEYNIVVNASNIDKDWNWLQTIKNEKNFTVELQNISDEVSLLALQGPFAKDLLQTLTDVDLSTIKYYEFQPGTISGIQDIIISNTGYTGSGGFELYVWNKDAINVWDVLMKAGKNYGLLPCGLAARDTLRIEKGYCLYGNDINENTSPLEAGLGWITKFNKDFIAKEILLKQKEVGLKQKLIGFIMLERAIPRNGYKIKNKYDNDIGVVTSGTNSPILNEGIGMGYVQSEFTSPNTIVYISIRNKLVKAKVIKLPFL